MLFSTLKLPHGLTIKMSSKEGPPPIPGMVPPPPPEDPETALERSIANLIGCREKVVSEFKDRFERAAGSEAADYQLVEEWDQVTRKVKWYYEKRK